MATTEAVVEAMRFLAGAFPGVTIGKQHIASYAEVLKNIDNGALLRAAREIAASDRKFFPRPGEILAVARRMESAWGLTEAAQRLWDAYFRGDFDPAEWAETLTGLRESGREHAARRFEERLAWASVEADHE